jgi:hypothetical protein
MSPSITFEQFIQLIALLGMVRNQFDLLDTARTGSAYVSFEQLLYFATAL